MSSAHRHSGPVFVRIQLQANRTTVAFSPYLWRRVEAESLAHIVMPENSSIITHKLTRKASPREEQEPNCKGVDQVHLSPQEQLTSHKVKMRQDDRTPAQSQRTSGGDIAPMLSSIKDKAVCYCD